MKHLLSLLLVFNLAIAFAQPCQKTPRIPFLNSDCQQIYNTVADSTPPPYAATIVPFHNTDLYQIYCAIMADTLDAATVNGLSWGLTGNSGTDPETNFVGTTDGENLIVGANPFHTGTTANMVFDVDRVSATVFVYDSVENGKHTLALSGGIDIQTSNFSTDTSAAISLRKDSIFFEFQPQVIPLTVYPTGIKIVDGNEGAGKVLTSDADGIASWGVTRFTASDSATIYATTPTVGTTYTCTDCSGTDVTGRIVYYMGGAWRRVPISLSIP